MHVEKNICDSLIGTLLNIPGKTKDGLKARLDMLDMNIRTKLAPQTEGKRTYLPPSCTTLSKNEKTILCGCLKGVKVPYGYDRAAQSSCANLQNKFISPLLVRLHYLVSKVVSRGRTQGN
ncbi:hypothetical protein QQ045_002706 [Rhodiola kirilowii]